MRKTIEIHDALADPPKKSGKYLAFVGFESGRGYWVYLSYGKDVNMWNVSFNRRTGLTYDAANAFDSVTHWMENFYPNEEAEA